MPYSFICVFCVIFLFGNCELANVQTQKPFKETFPCTKGLMKAAWYELGIDEPVLMHYNDCKYSE